MRSAVTISLVPEAAGGPFVFWNDVGVAAKKAQDLGFDAVEIFAPDGSAIGNPSFAQELFRARLPLAAVGTGAGWVRHKLSLTSPDPAIRQRAKDFVGAMIDAAAQFKAPAIVGSLQGRAEPNTDRDQQMEWLREAIDELGARADRHGQMVLFEPLNRYETNLVNSIAQGLELLASIDAKNVRLLMDVFHANIEEANIAESIRSAPFAIGHVHFADSNRRAVGMGHIDYEPIIAALREINYSGFLSAEVLPWPDSVEAAAQTMRSFHALVPGDR